MQYSGAMEWQGQAVWSDDSAYPLKLIGALAYKETYS